MKLLLAVIFGFVLGAGAIWLYHSREANVVVRGPTARTDHGSRSTNGWDLRPEDIMDELARSGKVVRRKAEEAGQVISDATADARVTATIKGRFLTHRELSALNISVNTTDGVVTLSGFVGSREEITKAMQVAFETDGVREVISTLQVRPLKRS